MAVATKLLLGKDGRLGHQAPVKPADSGTFPISHEGYRYLAAAAAAAPSGDNAQPWKFVVVDEPGLKERLARAAFSGAFAPTAFAGKAPVLVAALARTEHIYKDEKFSDHAPITVDYDFTL